MAFQKKANLTIEKAIEKFFKHLFFENSTENTIQWYRSVLYPWLKYMNRHNKCSVRNVSKDDIMNYIIYLRREKENNAASQNNKIRGLRSFFSFCIEEGYVDINPAKGLKIHETKKLPATFSLEQLDQLLYQPNRNTFAGYRDYITMIVLMDMALRISECLAIKLEDLVFEEDRIAAVFLPETKSREEQHVIVTDFVSGHLTAWIKHLEKKGYDGEWLFPALHGQGPIKKRSVQARMRKYGDQIGLKKCSPHMLRHSFGKCFTESGGNTRALQNHLRHKKISTTEIYSQIADKNMKDIVEKHAPSTLLKASGSKFGGATAKSYRGAKFKLIKVSELKLG